MRPSPQDIKRFRDEHKLSDLGQVFPEIVIDETGQPRALFRCGPCEEPLVWAEAGDLWLCPLCGFQLTRAQGAEVLDKAVALFATTRDKLIPKDQKPKDRRRWYDIFLRRRARLLPSKSS